MQAVALWARLGSGGSSTLHELAGRLCHFGHRLQAVRQAGRTALELWLIGQKLKREKFIFSGYFLKDSEKAKAVAKSLTVAFYVFHEDFVDVAK